MRTVAVALVLLLAGCMATRAPHVPTVEESSSTSEEPAQPTECHCYHADVMQVDDVGPPASEGYYELDWGQVPPANRSADLEEFMREVRERGSASVYSDHAHGNLTYNELWDALNEAHEARDAAAGSPGKAWMYDGPRVLFDGHVLMFRHEMLVS